MSGPELVAAIAERLTASYVFPERAAEAVALLRGRDYGDLRDEPLCLAINEDLLAGCGDKHLRVAWHAEPLAADSRADLEARFREEVRRENNGVRRVEHVGDGVALIEITVLPDAATAGASIGAAMRLVEHSTALVLDLRGCRGGAPDGVALWCSHLFADADVHLNDIVRGDEVRQFWTVGHVPGPRYLHRPVCVLVSERTFSGGEELAYDLQALERATIVGEATRGGAHPVESVALSDHIELRLPSARAVNPHTGGNWEGAGVQPDLAVPAAQALDAALSRLRSPAAP